MEERYKFQDEETDGLMTEIFNSPERLQSREYKTAAELDKQEKISVEQMHLIMHVFFVDQDASLVDNIRMVSEVLLAGPELSNDYPEADALNEKAQDVKKVFDLFTASEETKH